jgi:hypothetical protein
MFNNENIVKLLEYYEDDNEIVMYMEMANDGGYLERKLESRHSEIKNEVKLKMYA